MYSYALTFLFLSLLALSNGNTLEGTIDTRRLQKILEEGVKSKEISTLYYSLKGLKELNAKIPDVCQQIKATTADVTNIEQVFYLTNAAALSGCVNYLSPEVLAAPNRVLDKKDASIVELYYAVYSLKAVGKGAPMNKDEALKNLVKLLKKDDSPLNYGYVFALCEHLGCEKWAAAHAEGLLLAADESDARALHFEGGLPVTSLLLSAIFRTHKALGQAPPLSEVQRLKFAQYLVSRRAVSSPRGAALLLEPAKLLAAEQPTPMSISIKGKKYVTSDAESIEFVISDLLGGQVRGLKPEEVVAQSGTRLSDDVVVLSKQPLTQKSDDPTTYALSLNKIKAQYGLYKIALSAGSKTANLVVAVLGEIQVDAVEVGVGDVDGTTSPKVTTVAYPSQLTEKLQADHLQKVSLKLSVRDARRAAVAVAQAFVRVAPADAGAADDREAIFVAEPDNNKAYKVDLNVGAIGKHLNYESGLYSLTIFLGDSAVSNPISWSIGNVQLTFGNALAPSPSPAKPTRATLPEIAHAFRAAEPRPARAVSDVFAAACAAPLLLLLLLWARLGLNLAALPATPSAPLFHLALGGSLALYGVLWLQLTMFETVRYLAPLAALAFLSGHRLLRRLAADKR